MFIGILLVLAFFPVLLGGKTFFYRDFGVMGIPTVAYFKESLLRSEFPLWNPYSNCGVPFFAQWGTMVLYPGSLLFLLLPLPWSLNLFCVAHLFLAGMGVYFLARRLIADEWGAAFSAFAFVFSGVTLSTLTWPNYVAAIGLMPWVVLLSLRGMERGGTQMVWGAFAGAAQFMTGTPEICAMTWCVTLFLGIAEGFTLGRACRFLLVHCLVIALCAVQLLPFFELLEHSHRAGAVITEKWSLPPWGWGNLILPLFHAFQTPEGTWFQYGQQFLSSTYLGGGTLILALGALLLAKTTTIRILALLAVFGAVLALGSHGFLYTFLTNAFPALGIARYPVKLVFLVALPVALLAGAGMHSMNSLPKERREKLLGTLWVVFILISLALLWQAKTFPLQYDQWKPTLQNSIFRMVAASLVLAAMWKLGSSGNSKVGMMYQIGILIVLFLDGVSHLDSQNPVVASTVFSSDFRKQSGATSLQLKEGRMFITPEAEAAFLYSKVKAPEADLAGKRLGLWSHLNLLEPVSKVNGSATLQMSGQKVIEGLIYDSKVTPEQREPLLKMLQVRFKTSPASAVEWVGTTNISTWLSAGQELKVLSKEQLTNAMLHAFDPARVVYLEPQAGLTNRAAGQVSIVNQRVGTHEIVCTVSATNDSVLFIPQSWHPAWKAEDATSRTRFPILRANGGFQAILISAGTEKTIRIFYSDKQFLMGGIFSGLTLAGCGIYAVLRSGKRKPAGGAGREVA